MTSSTSSKFTVRILSGLLVLALLYIIFVPAHSATTNVSPTKTGDHEASRLNIDTSFVKTAVDKVTQAVSGDSKTGADAIEEEEELQEDESDEGLGDIADVGDHISGGKEAVDDDQLTPEEKAVQDYHQEHGQNQPTRDRPKVAVKPNPKTSAAVAATSTGPIIAEVTIPEIRHHTQINNASAAEHLILVVTRDETHWGHVDGKPRTFSSFLEFLNDTSGLPLSSVSLAILTTTEEAYTHYVSTLSSHPIAKAQVLLYTPTIPEAEAPADRHDPSFQPIRRKQIALARNILLHRSLADEQHIFFYDADIISSTPKICTEMLHQASTPKITKSENVTIPEVILPVGLITTRAQENSNPDYDLNAWYHSGTVRKDRDVHMQKLTSVTSSDEIFPLDSVGGVLLYIKAELVRQGLAFPWWFVVGGSWEKGDGSDGIETEGICYLAERLGYGCWGLGGEWHVVHQH
ncbi:unnamed protein product [Aureobasidium pullulans]|nr:unnamed protein product [Aureobasidium pullulans]